MSDDHLNEDIALFLIDGPVCDDIKLPISTLREQVVIARSYSEYSSVNPNFHADFVQTVAARAAFELQNASDWLNAHSNADGLYIRPSFVDGKTHGARVDEKYVINASSRDCIIYVRLGGIPLLLGIANRLQTMRDEGGYGAFLDGVFRPGIDHIQWDPETEPIGSLTLNLGDPAGELEETYEIVINALLLIFFHEAAHACAAHAYIAYKLQKSSLYSQYAKALEAEADWGSGLMFMKYRSRSGRVLDEPRLCRDFIFGTQCNYLALQVALGRKNGESVNYHFPYARTACTLMGARQAWEASSNFVGDFNRLIADASHSLFSVDALFPRSIKGWLSTEDERAVQDRNTLGNVTLGLWLLLRASHHYKRARPLDEFLFLRNSS